VVAVVSTGHSTTVTVVSSCRRRVAVDRWRAVGRWLDHQNAVAVVRSSSFKNIYLNANHPLCIALTQWPSSCFVEIVICCIHLLLSWRFDNWYRHRPRSNKLNHGHLHAMQYNDRIVKFGLMSIPLHDAFCITVQHNDNICWPIPWWNLLSPSRVQRTDNRATKSMQWLPENTSRPVWDRFEHARCTLEISFDMTRLRCGFVINFLGCRETQCLCIYRFSSRDKPLQQWLDEMRYLLTHVRLK